MQIFRTTSPNKACSHFVMETIQFTQDKLKIYLFEVTWGEERNTDDIEGAVINTSNNRPTQKQIEEIIPQFIGEIEQIPPKFSAIKINGQRAYKMSRAGEDVNIPPRKVNIISLKLISYSKDSAIFEMECGKGTYVRSVGRDMGRILNCLGYISSLERTKVGVFTKKDAILLDKLEEIVLSSPDDLYVLPVETVLDDISELALTKSEIERIEYGRCIEITEDFHLTHPEWNYVKSDILLSLNKGTPLALLKVERNELKIMRKFNL